MPFSIARIGERATCAASRRRHAHLTRRRRSHPAGRRRHRPGRRRRTTGRVVQRGPRPPRSRPMGIVDGEGEIDRGRAVYLMTRDNMLEGDSEASGLARRLKRINPAPAPLRIQVPAHVAANFEGLVVRVDDADAPVERATSGSWCARSTTPPPGPSPVFAISRRRAGRRRTAPSPSTTSGSCTTSPPTRSRPRTAGATPRSSELRAHLRSAAEGRAGPRRARAQPPVALRDPAAPACPRPRPRRRRPGCSAGRSRSWACTPSTPTPIPASTSRGDGR